MTPVCVCVCAADLTEAHRGQNIDLHVSVILEAQVGAIYLLYCLYCTQPFPQPTRIYLSPFNLAAMHRMLKVCSLEAYLSQGCRVWLDSWVTARSDT